MTEDAWRPGAMRPEGVSGAGGDEGTTVWQGVACGLLAAFGPACSDFFDALGRLHHASSVDALLLAAAALATLFVTGAAAGAFCVAWARLVGRLARSRSGSRGALLGHVLLPLPLALLALVAFAGFVRSAWKSFWPLEWAVVSFIAVVMIPGSAWLFAFLIASPPARVCKGKRRGLAVALATSAGVALVFVDRRFVTLPGELHDVVALHAALAFAVAARWVLVFARPRFLTPRPVWTAAGTAVVTLVALETVDARPPAATLFYGKLALALRAATDVDGDGSSSLFGGRDCRAFDARFAPSRRDVPGNGSDENCTGNDAPKAVEARRATYPIPDLRGHNVVWLSIDALRADHVGAYGYPKNTTPNIDRLAREGMRFERAFVQSTSTWDSVPSMLSGRYPHHLSRDYDAARARRWYTYVVGAETPLLGDVLADNGYTTAGFAAFRLFDKLGFSKRFQSYRRTTELREEGGRFVASAREPFLLWEHLPYPHEPYELHAGFAFGSDAIGRYDGEIAYADAVVGEIVAGLSRRGVLERTIIVITADHGEAFGEHGKWFHGRSCYVEQTRVPLVLRSPRLPAAVVRAPVELVDVLPTLFEMLGIGRRAVPLDGESLLRALADPAFFSARGASCEYYRSGVTLQSLASGNWKLISDLERDAVELYAVDRDPAERVNVERHEPGVREALLEKLGRRYALP